MDSVCLSVCAREIPFWVTRTQCASIGRTGNHAEPAAGFPGVCAAIFRVDAGRQAWQTRAACVGDPQETNCWKPSYL